MSTSQLYLDLAEKGHGDRKAPSWWCCCGMLDSLKKQMKEGSFLERVREIIFDVGVTKACHVELDGLEANLVGKVSSKEAE